MQKKIKLKKFNIKLNQIQNQPKFGIKIKNSKIKFKMKKNHIQNEENPIQNEGNPIQNEKYQIQNGKNQIQNEQAGTALGSQPRLD